MDLGCNRSAPLPDSLWRFPGQHGNARPLLRRSLLPLVLGAAVKLLTNPIIVRMIAVALASGFSFVIGLALMRRMRRSITKDVLVDKTTLLPKGFPCRRFML